MSEAPLNAQLHEIIGLIYDAALDPERWPIFMQKLSESFGGNSVFFAQDATAPAANLYQTAGFEEAPLRSYVEHYAGTNVWTPHLAKLRSGAVASGDDLVPRAVFEKTEFFNDWLKPQGLAYGIGGIVANERNLLTQISIIRPAKVGAYSGFERDVFQVVTTHLRRAVTIHRELAGARLQRDAAIDGMERLGVAAFLVDIDARILFANPAGSTLLSEGDGLLAPDGRLAARNGRRTEQLLHLVRQAARAAAGIGHHPGGAMPLPRRDRRPLTALISPMKGEALAPGLPVPAALIFVRDPTRRMITQPDALKVLFGLTASEARVAMALTDGESPEEVASRLQTSIHTVRLHIKNAMAKMGVHRQAEMVAIILRSAAALAHDPDDDGDLVAR